jgi:NADH-quinone oxidoreductase subunit J
MEDLLFYLFAAIALVTALGVVVSRRVFYSALSLIVCLSALAGIYLLLRAPFIAAVQIIVYAGAIMVLFLFVIMLLDPFAAGVYRDRKRYLSAFAVLLGTGVLFLLLPLIRSYDPAKTPRELLPLRGGHVELARLAETLFNDYLLPFEVTSVLILVAIIGAVVLAKRQA